MSKQLYGEGFLRVVALETSGQEGSLAAVRVAGDEIEVVCRHFLPRDCRTAQSLVPAMETLLETCRWKVGEINLVCTTTGPGSFTGLRIGVTTAKTLSFATGAKLVGVNTLAAIADQVGPVQNRVWAILDAQRQELFAACFPPGWQTDDDLVPETHVLSCEAWINQLQAGDLVSGPPLKSLAERLPATVVTTDSACWSPTAETVARLGIAVLRHDGATEPVQLVPQYFRKSAAEEKAE